MPLMHPVPLNIIAHPPKMDRCSNLRRTEDGTYEDPITFEPVDMDRLISFTRGNHTFCYDAVTLMKFLRMKENELPGGRNVLPETNSPLTVEELATLYERGLSFFPEMYVVARGDTPLPYSFTDKDAAIRYVTEQGYGSVFAYHLFNDAELYLAFYPHGVESMRQVFGVRGPATPVLRRQSAVYVPPSVAAPADERRDAPPAPRRRRIPARNTANDETTTTTDDTTTDEEMDTASRDDAMGGNDIMQHARRLAARAQQSGMTPQRVASQRGSSHQGVPRSYRSSPRTYRTVARQLEFDDE